MGRRWHRALTGLVVSSVWVAFGVGPGVAETPAQPGDDLTQTASRFAGVDPSLIGSDGQPPTFVPAALSEQQVSVVLEMTGAPVAVQDAAAQKQGRSLTPDEKRAIRQQLEASQNQLHSKLAAAGAQVVGQMQDAYNGIQVVVSQGGLAQLAGLPGVAAVHGVQTFSPDNTNGVPFIGAPQAWQDAGVTGAGVKIGIIDTGIDYTHADFGGPGTVAAWNAAKATSTAPADPSLFGPAAPKVKGGFDFVGDAYNAANPASIPVPDPNPLDCNGHGSHTAGTLAGFGVLSSGTTFHGPYESTTVTSHSWNVGPGVAPKASLFAYRVFGCQGSSNVVALAINRAVADGVDVISMSLGSPLGGTDDPTSVAAQNAFNAGIAVVASAGNSGTNAYLVGSPSTANGVLSVAAMDASFATFPGANLSLSTSGGASAGTVVALDANGAALPSGSHRVKVLRNPDNSISLGCNESEYAGTAGMVVVTMRGSCARVARAVFGDKAGDAAVVMINTSATYPPFEGPITSNPDTGEMHTVTIPFLGVRGVTADVAALLAADGGSVTLTATTVVNPGYKVAASFTSGGPRSPDSAPKPDVIAPGVSVASVGMGTGTAAVFMSGTSMACPMTAGIAALVKEAHPSWKGSRIKAAIVNTANPDLNVGYISRIAGAGVVQAQNAVNSSVLATTGDALDSIAFGFVAGGATYSASKTFTLTNTGTTAATYNLSVVPNGSLRGAGITVSPATVNVAGGVTAMVTVMLSMPAAAFAALPSDDTFSVGPGGVITVRGNIVASPAAGEPADHQTLRVPFILVPRGLSNVHAGAPGAFRNVTSSTTRGTPGNTLAASLTVNNNGIHSGTADLYVWGVHSPRAGGQANDVRDVGVQILPGTVLRSTANDRSLVFLVNTWGKAATQSLNEFDVLIDNNGDGVPDFVVVGADVGLVLGGTPDGRYGSFTFNVANPRHPVLLRAFLADAPMNGSLVELPALASDLGLSEKANGVGPVKKEGMTYRVQAFAVKGGGGFVKVTGATTINPFSPSVSSGDFATLAPGASTAFTLTVDPDQEKKEPALGWLVAAVDNANGAPQASEVAFTGR